MIALCTLLLLGESGARAVEEPGGRGRAQVVPARRGGRRLLHSSRNFFPPPPEKSDWPSSAASNAAKSPLPPPPPPLLPEEADIGLVNLRADYEQIDFVDGASVAELKGEECLEHRHLVVLACMTFNEFSEVLTRRSVVCMTSADICDIFTP